MTLYAYVIKPTSHSQLLYTGPQLSLFALLSFVSRALHHRPPFALLYHTCSVRFLQSDDAGLVRLKLKKEKPHAWILIDVLHYC